MENKFELVEKYNIDVDVFIEENGVSGFSWLVIFLLSV
jgi:hypothetical protein